MLNTTSQILPFFNLTANFLNQSYIKKLHNFLVAGDALCMEKKYTLFVSAHLAKDKQIDAEYCCKHFRNVIDRKLCGRSRRLYKALFIENGQYEYCNSYCERHAHWLFELPVNLTEEEFTKVFKIHWQEICGSKNVVIKKIENKLGGINGLYEYLNKERALGNMATFIEDCSDNARLQNNREKIEGTIKATNTGSLLTNDI